MATILYHLAALYKRMGKEHEASKLEERTRAIELKTRGVDRNLGSHARPKSGEVKTRRPEVGPHCDGEE